jgi:hypothetical protein
VDPRELVGDDIADAAHVPRFDIRAPPRPVLCNQARPARPLLELRKLRFHGELAWGKPKMKKEKRE